MCFSSPSIPAATPPPQAPTAQDPAVQAALDADRKRRAAAGGSSSTITNTGGALGLPGAPTAAPKTILGA